MMAFPIIIGALLASALLLRRWPLVALAVTLGVSTPVLALNSTTPKITLLVLQVVIACAAGLQICYLAATRNRTVSIIGVAMGGAGLLVALLGDPSAGPLPSDSVGRQLVTVVGVLIMIIAWLIGHSIRQAHAQVDLLRTQAATQTALAERLRIARELHDIVAHSIGIIAIQAGAGRRVFDARPDQARDALAAIEATSRETLSGLRRMVTGLRRTEPEPAPGQPPRDSAPGLADLERLAAATRAAGVAVDVDWHGSREPLPADIDLAAYRIVQEALTNVVRHAGTDQCQVSVDQQYRQLSIEVIDSGHAGATAATGYGITGMRERAALLGGDFSAGPRPGGGFRVATRLPLPAPAKAR